MTLVGAPISPKPFIPGTTGWTAADLGDPAIESAWMAGRYEIIEGVLTLMPPAYFTGGEAAFRLVFLLESHLRATGASGGGFSPEADIVISPRRVVRADFAYLTGQQKVAQREASEKIGRKDARRSRILVPPMLIIESVSPGHEAHDHETKRSWYAAFGVRHYWLLNVFDRSLTCLVLEASEYREECQGRSNEVVTPSLFPGLRLPLAEVWPD